MLMSSCSAMKSPWHVIGLYSSMSSAYTVSWLPFDNYKVIKNSVLETLINEISFS